MKEREAGCTFSQGALKLRLIPSKIFAQTEERIMTKSFRKRTAATLVLVLTCALALSEKASFAADAELDRAKESARTGGSSVIQ